VTKIWRAKVTFVIGQIQEELKLDLAYQRIPSKLICAVVGVVVCKNQEIGGDHLIGAIHRTRSGWITKGLSME
jgi:hypothetical protein